MRDFREVHGHLLELLLLLAGLLGGFLASGFRRGRRVRRGRGRGFGFGDVLVGGEERAFLVLDVGILLLLLRLLLRRLGILRLCLFNRGSLGHLGVDRGRLRLLLGRGLCFRLELSLSLDRVIQAGCLVAGLGVVLLVLLHGGCGGGGGDPLLLHQAAAQRVELHVVLLAQRQEVLLHHHDLDHDLILLRRGFLRAGHGSRRGGDLLLDGLLACGELVDECANLLELRHEHSLERSRGFSRLGDGSLVRVTPREPRGGGGGHRTLELHELLLLDGGGLPNLLPERLELLIRREVRHPLRRLHRRVVRPAAARAEQRSRHRGRARQNLRVLHGGGAVGDSLRPRLPRAPQLHVRVSRLVRRLRRALRLLLEGRERGPSLECVRYGGAPRGVFVENLRQQRLLGELTGKVHSLEEHLAEGDERGSAGSVDVLVHLLGVVELEDVARCSQTGEAGVLLRVPGKGGGDPRASEVVPVAAHVAPEHLAAARLSA